MPTSSTYPKNLSSNTGVKVSSYPIMIGISALFGRLSASTVDRMAYGLAVLLFDVLRLRRKLVLKNLNIAFGDTKPLAEKKRLGRLSIYHFLLTGFEFLRSRHHDIAGDIEIENPEHLRTALAEGKGVYILCFHMGNWEAMGAKITRAFAPANVVVKKVGGAGVDRFVTETRMQNGFIPLQRKKKGDGYRLIKEALSRGELIGFVMDQARPGEPKYPFFGTPAKTNTSLAAIWLKNPAPIVPSYIVRNKIGNHTIKFFPALNLPVTGDSERDVKDLSILFNQEVETHVRAQPDQYLWMHNRWK